MAKVDKYFLGAQFNSTYDFRDKDSNRTNLISYMLNRTLEMFHYSGLPETIPQMELERLLQTMGYCIVAPDNDGALRALWGGLGGEMDGYYHPTICTVANPYLNINKNFMLNGDCVFCMNDSTIVGLMPMFERYNALLVEADLTIYLASLNIRNPKMLVAGDDTAKASAEKYLADLEDGKLGVLADNRLFESIKTIGDTRNMTSLTDLFEFTQYIKGSMMQEIGLESQYNLKRAQLTAEESSQNNDCYPLVDNMLHCRQDFIEKINQMYGTNIKVELASSWALREFGGTLADAREGTDVGDILEKTEEPQEEQEEQEVEKDGIEKDK